uniref:hypothetical protein n=1 Tax=Brucella pseudintermedia TaxID=370111 RepID=UPI00158DDD19|nr:hypothetical protein [Brucella pseudintermedia]
MEVISSSAADGPAERVTKGNQSAGLISAPARSDRTRSNLLFLSQYLTQNRFALLLEMLCPRITDHRFDS